MPFPSSPQPPSSEDEPVEVAKREPLGSVEVAKPFGPGEIAKPLGPVEVAKREPFGPVEVERHLKADGRTLILYARDGYVLDRERPNTTLPRRKTHAREPSSVSELRFNELRGERVVYAIHRQDRTFLPPAEHCPLCPTQPGGIETEVPFSAFEIVVFENRFPAFDSRPPEAGGAGYPAGAAGGGGGGGGGAAEVIVYTDSHHGSLGSLPSERAEALMWVWRHRYRELAGREDVRYVLIFENRGVEVGVTLHHPHGQIYGYPFLPPVPELELAADHRLGRCAPCALLRRELDDGARIVYENEALVAFVPYAARWPYEAHVTMREHRPSLLDCREAELRQLAEGLQALVRGYDALFDKPFPYVMVVHQAPTSNDQSAQTGHLHVELYPPLRTAEKLKYIAGSEQGAGTFISDTLPERSARALAEAIRRAA